MNKIRLGLALVSCALAPFAITGCAGDGDKGSDTAPAAIASPAPAAEKLNKDLAALAVRVKAADAALARVVSESATDPEERLLALDKAVRDIGPASAVSLGAELKTAGAAIVAGWQANAAAITDAELRKVAVVAGDEAKANFDAVEAALRKTDESLNYHAALLREARMAIGARPNATTIVAARPSVARVTAFGKKVDGWLTYAARQANAAGRSPVPTPVVAAPAATPEPVKAAPADAAPAAPVEAKPATPEAPAPKPVEAAPPAVIATPTHVEVEIKGEPQPKPSEPDPIPEPTK